MSENHIPPHRDKKSFHCPNCGIHARQYGGETFWLNTHKGKVKTTTYGDWKLSKKHTVKWPTMTVRLCENCDQFTVWIGDAIVAPSAASAPLPADDMPENVEKHYLEARQIVDQSPRAAAAILRLAMEELAQDLTGNENKSLYQNIGQLMEDGKIDSRIQKALDSVRITGNDYVHAGEIQSNDDRETALQLFDLVNVIVELLITREKLIEEAYSEIPDNKLEGIEQRDG